MSTNRVRGLPTVLVPVRAYFSLPFSRSGAQRKKRQAFAGGTPPLPIFISADNIKPYISNSLETVLSKCGVVKFGGRKLP